ncbi:MAG TPA: hypothetical protein VLA93_02860 [Pyrinomonadaceae bacterium]|nr:hypothetical protein [Pyrinomonadaceae bacterium]
MHALTSYYRVFALLLAAAPSTVFAQSMTYPKEIRGYKLERAAVELKETKQKNEQQNGASQLIQFGNPRVAGVTPLGITLEIPVVVAPVKQKGRVDFLVFEKMKVNGTAVEIDEYHRAFDLPNKKPLTLKEPLRFYVYLPNALMVVIDELNSSVKQWPITGVVYVFGRFNKSIFRFKRVIPIEINLMTPNPLHEK